MNTKIIETQWSGYETLMPIQEVIKRLSRPLELIGEDMIYLIPSFGLGTDGPFIQKLFFVTKTMVCEVRSQNSLDAFDFVMLDSIANYRVNMGVHKVLKQLPSNAPQVPGGEPQAPVIETVLYETAQIKFIHDFSAGFESAIDYVGKSREPWLKCVERAFPSSILRLRRGH
jgi:hypothetical protein